MTLTATNDRSHPDRLCIIKQGKALVLAIEALGIIEPSGPIEQALARLLMAAYKRRLRATAGDRCEPVDVGDRRRL